MPTRYVEWAPWVDDLCARDPRLGRIIRDAVLAREVAVRAGAASPTASKRCRDTFERGEKALDLLRLGQVEPNTPAARRRAHEAAARFCQALEITGR